MLVKLINKAGFSTTTSALRSSFVLTRKAKCDISVTLAVASPSPSSLSLASASSLTSVLTASPHPRRDTYGFVSSVSYQERRGEHLKFARRHLQTAGSSEFEFGFGLTPRTSRDIRLKSLACLLPARIGQRTFTATAASAFTSTSTIAATTIGTTADTAVSTTGSGAGTYSASSSTSPSSSSSTSTPSSSTTTTTTTTEPTHMEQQHQHNYHSEPTTRVIKRKQPPTMTSPDKATKQLRAAHDRFQDESAASATLAVNGMINGSRGRKSGAAGAAESASGVGPDANAGMLDGSVASGYESDASMSPVMAQTSQGADTAEWQATIERVVKSVVSIHFCQTHSFDTEQALSSEATGFVVDAERGYILTNRVGCLMQLRCLDFILNAATS